MADRQTIERLKDQALEMRELILKLSAKTLMAKLAPALQSAVLREYSEYARTQEECELIAQNRLNSIAMGLVSGEGACIGIPELIPGRYIEIDGLDSRTNGGYFISRVKHRFDSEGYSTTFEVKGAKTK